MIRSLRRRVIRKMLGTYKRRIQENVQLDVAHCLMAAANIVDKNQYGFLTTYGKEPWPNTRLVQPIIDEQFTFWIGTNPDLRKVAEVKENPHVTFAFQDNKRQANLILQGKATIVDDLELRRKYWKGEWQLFFPGGSQSDEYILIRIDVEKMELMSFEDNVVPEPFGLKPVKLIKQNGEWQTTNVE